MTDHDDNLAPSTLAIHGGHYEDQHGAVNVPIYASSTFSYPTVQEGAARFAGEKEGFVYGRLSNPSVQAVEKKLALLEGGEDAVLFGSGMGAVATLVFTALKAGDHVVADHTLYGGSHSLFTHKLPEMNIEVTFVDASNIGEVREAIRENTRLIYAESQCNPTMRLVPIEPIVELAKQHGIMTAIDATFMSPILQQPLLMGVDVVMHSVTKFLAGHSNIIGGVLIGSEEFIAECKMTRVHYGGIMSPFDAFLLDMGIRTLPIRIRQHQENAEKIAHYLKHHEMVDNFVWVGDEDNPYYELAKQQQNGFGSMMTFELKGTLEMAMAFVNALKLHTRAVSLGGVETLISHPASTTHAIVEPEDRLEAGITDTLMRLSVGLEDTDDMIADLDQAFNSLRAFQQIEH